jgi:hypothetical protein
MVRYAVKHRLADPAALRDFDLEGYRFAGEVSDENRLVFRRQLAGA